MAAGELPNMHSPGGGNQSFLTVILSPRGNGGATYEKINVKDTIIIKYCQVSITLLKYNKFVTLNKLNINYKI